MKKRILVSILDNIVDFCVLFVMVVLFLGGVMSALAEPTGIGDLYMTQFLASKAFAMICFILLVVIIKKVL